MLAMLLPPLRRITFYLAQTMMAIARHEEAHGWYEKRVALGGWHVSDVLDHVRKPPLAPSCTSFDCCPSSEQNIHQDNALGSACALLRQYMSLFQPTFWTLVCTLWGQQDTTGSTGHDTWLMLS